MLRTTTEGAIMKTRRFSTTFICSGSARLTRVDCGSILGTSECIFGRRKGIFEWHNKTKTD